MALTESLGEVMVRRGALFGGDRGRDTRTRVPHRIRSMVLSDSKPNLVNIHATCGCPSQRSPPSNQYNVKEMALSPSPSGAYSYVEKYLHGAHTAQTWPPIFCRLHENEAHGCSKID